MSPIPDQLVSELRDRLRMRDATIRWGVEMTPATQAVAPLPQPSSEEIEQWLQVPAGTFSALTQNRKILSIWRGDW